MATALARYERYTRRRKRHAAEKEQRLDIQGLRMVAVLTVFANHLWGWPHGGFIGVDVFFVISGFLITGNLLRTAKNEGQISFRHFYWNRVRRIVPAATVVLLLTYVAATLVFLPFRAEQIGIDALWAFVFFANWHFAIQNTDYFNATDAVSPIQHYWSLSIEEQFYFVWPALIFLISLIVVRKAWDHTHRMRFAAITMSVVVAASLGWALYQTQVAAPWAYFDTFARVWELGVGALLACLAGTLERIPNGIKPVLSWGGLALIAASLFLISDESVGFPAPWALLPVAGAAFVIAAGVGGEPRHQAFLQNPASGYIGDISYSLYLVHWPVIVILGSLMAPNWSYYTVTVAAAFMLAIASYHFVENPLRRASWGKLKAVFREMRHREYRPERRTGYAALSVMTLAVVALTAFTVRPDAYQTAAPPITEEDAAPDLSAAEFGPPLPVLGPLATTLQGEIVTAAKATEWPALNPSMEDVITQAPNTKAIVECIATNDPIPAPAQCQWGSPAAPIRVVIVGDSIAGSYAVPLRDIALNSQGQINVYSFSLGACVFGEEIIDQGDQMRAEACPARKQAAIEYINQTRPNLVVISNTYRTKKALDNGEALGPNAWIDTMRPLVDRIKGAAGKVVIFAPPPIGPDTSECYGTRGSVPANCAGRVTGNWLEMAVAENDYAKSIGGVWIDSRPWFCSEGTCPPFVGTTPTRRDRTHIVPAYGTRIYPVIEESLRQVGAF